MFFRHDAVNRMNLIFPSELSRTYNTVLSCGNKNSGLQAYDFVVDGV